MNSATPRDATSALNLLVAVLIAIRYAHLVRTYGIQKERGMGGYKNWALALAENIKDRRLAAAIWSEQYGERRDIAKCHPAESSVVLDP